VLRSGDLRVMNRRLRPGYDDDLAGDLIALVGLDQYTRRYLGDYSHGMKRKLQLCIALAHRPAVLILDEPMRGLDPEAVVMMRQLISTFSGQGGGLLMATHDLVAAESTCDRVVILSDGRTVATGSPRELVRSTGVNTLEEFFVQATGLAERIEGVRRAISAIDFHPAARVPDVVNGGSEQ
jgi:ABC-2 type transport system ATP-binding protein